MVLFSDDIANVVDNPITLQRVYTLLSEALAWFNMRFDKIWMAQLTRCAKRSL
jgi:hypothetical protein